jgi:F0F1-type ATP synthase membrane subunit b/b'
MYLKPNTSRLALACALLLGAAAAWADVAPLNEAEFEAAKSRLQKSFEAKQAKADDAYKAAKKACKSLKGDARDACRDRAEHEHEAAIRLTKVEKVDSLTQLKSRLVERQARASRP